MKKFFLIIISLSVVGCNSVLVTYKPPQNSNLTKLKLPKDDNTLYKLSELNEKGCAVNFRTVRAESYLDSENVYVQANKSIVLHVNKSGRTICRGTEAMSLESNKHYEADIFPVRHFCLVSIYDITDGKKGEKVENASLNGCVKE
ncbi:hypothetical protein ACJJIP_07625 [Microbulbifer sp. VTAC004]|uniref:hypothetical protein n=1 Tax=Microbulbifer sp. VTAC004 TaxID=3243386 RepID=UPI004039773F